MKRTVSFFLAFLLGITLNVFSTPQAAAADSEALQAAQQLYDLGLFNGVGTNADGTPDFDLDRAPTRAEAVTMLMRIFRGMTEGGYVAPDLATGGYYWGEYDFYCPFTDVVDWAKPYVAYAYSLELTKGRTETVFDSYSPVTATEYLTMVLRVMGYESGVDFRWDRAWELTDQLGITDGRYPGSSAFTRGDAAMVSLNALKQYSPLMEVRTSEKEYPVIMTYPDNEDREWVGDFLFTPIVPLRDVRIVENNMWFGEDGSTSGVGETLQYVGNLVPGEALRVWMPIAEFTSDLAIQFTDQEGRERAFTIFDTPLKSGFYEIN